MAQDQVAGNPENLKDQEEIMFPIEEGRASISISNADVSSGIIFDDLGQALIDNFGAVGILIRNGTVFIQGVLRNTSKGENLIKGEYSENPRSAKKFTYTEFVPLASAEAETAYRGLAGETGGELASKALDYAGAPIITDVSPGPLPHVHAITQFKHVHRIEPAYLFRVPSSVGIITGVMKKLQQFFSA